MVTSIQLGNIFSQNDRQVISGGQSGFDIEGLVNGLTEARRQPAVILEKNIEKNQKTSEALGQMKDILTRFQDASNFLRNPPGVQNDSDNVFKYRSVSLQSSNGVDPNTYVSVLAEPGAQLTDYTLSVNQLATRSIYTTNTMNIANANTAIVGPSGGNLLQAGTLTLGGVDITLEDGDTLNQVVSKINAASGESGVEALSIRVADGEYRLSIRSLETGTANELNLGASATFTNIGFATTQTAQDAIITFDGNTITRSSNTISDVIDDISFTLKQVTPAGVTINAEVEADIDLAVDGILNFVDAYNEFRLFRSGQRELGSNGQPLDSAVLNRSNSLSQTNSRVSAEITSLVDGLAVGDPARLADIGITLTDFPGNAEAPFTRNILVVDEAKLRNALAEDYDAVARVFGFDYSSDDPNLQIFQRTNALNVTAFELNIDQTNGVYQASYTDSLGNAVTVDLDVTPNALDGVTLRGKEGTDLEGLVMIYGSNDDAVVNVTVSQGVADRVYNTLGEVLNENTGAVALELRSISQQNERWQQSISRIDDQITRYRDQLLEQYSALEAAISQANTLLQTLDAQANARANQ